MKKLLLMVLLLISVINLKAQEGEEVGWVARFGAAGGVAPAFVFPNLEPVNTQIKKMGIGQLSTSGMFLLGGGGYAYIMMIDNLRIGGIGIGGSQLSTGIVDGFNKEVKYGFGLGGLTLEYTLPFINNIAVSVGAIIGAGSSSIEVFQSNSNFDWNNIFNEVADKSKSTQNINHKLTNDYFTISPTLNIDIPLNRFIALRIGGGYVAAFSDNWKADNAQTVSNLPNDLNSNSFFFQTGVYFGFFAF